MSDFDQLTRLVEEKTSAGSYYLHVIEVKDGIIEGTSGGLMLTEEPFGDPQPLSLEEAWDMVE